MDLGHLADFFEFVLASGPQPPGCGPETSTNSKKSPKGPRSISQSQMIQKFIFGTKTISKILPRCHNIFRNKYEGSSSHFFYFEQMIWADIILSIFHSIHFTSVTMQIAVPWNAEKLRQDIFKNSCKTCHEVGLLTESTHGGMEI